MYAHTAFKLSIKTHFYIFMSGELDLDDLN